MRKLWILICLLTLAAMPVWASGAKEIRTAEDLKAIAEDPSGSYILMNDLDLAGIPWKSIDFSGSFDGNGHSILNLSVAEPGDAHWEALDGNVKPYDAEYYGLFGFADNAHIFGLHMVNVRTLLISDNPCFLGGIAGAGRDTTFTDCSVTGRLEVRAHVGAFGVGGIAGYGSGWIRQCSADVTLITVDTDPDTKDEQFLGGACSTGFMDVTDSVITLDGYISEHGYVHSGGIAGMFMRDPIGKGRTGDLVGNTVSGRIQFYEDNNNRRAYCSPTAGEVLAKGCRIWNNKVDGFRKEELWKFSRDTELRPDTCPDPVYAEERTEPDCDSFGFTRYTCQGCGYSYTDNYCLTRHTFTEWAKGERTPEGERYISFCAGCGAENSLVVPDHLTRGTVR